MTTNSPNHRTDALSLAFGTLLIFLGVLFAIARFVDFNIASFAWPLYIIAPGTLLFIFAMTLRDSPGVVFSSIGLVITSVGVLLFYQNVTGHWQSWAYAWALVTVTAVGLAQIFHGTFHGRTGLVRVGMRVAGIGLAIFLGGAFFFELVIGFSGLGLGSLGVAMIFVLVGVGFILRPLISATRQNIALDDGTLNGGSLDSSAAEMQEVQRDEFISSPQ